MSQAARRSPAASVEALETRFQAVLERAAARAAKEGDAELESARRVETHIRVRSQLQAAETDIRQLAGADDLTPYGQSVLREARAFRTRIREEISGAQEQCEHRARSLYDCVEQVRRKVRRARRIEDPRQRLKTMLEAMRPLEAYVTNTERLTLERLRVSVEELVVTPPPPPAAEAVAVPAVAAPPPAPWVFEEPDAGFFAVPPPGGSQDLDAYHLNRQAHQLSLVRGFDALLTPSLAHDLVQYPHQIETARVVLRRMRGRALLCDEVGLGKTIEAGIIAKEYAARGLVRRILILTPPALVAQWRQEMREKFDLEFVTHEDSEFRRHGAEAWGRFDRILASMHTAKLSPHRERLVKEQFDLIIVDEAHHLRSRTSQSWKFLNELHKRYVLLLTATPVQNDLHELFNLITLLSPGQLSTSSAFRREFVTRGDPRTPQNRERLRQLLAEVMVRNTRSQVHIALPPRLATTHRVTPSPEEAALYAGITAFARESAAEGPLERMALGSLLRQAGSSAPAAAHALEGLAERRPAHRERLQELADMARSVSRQAKIERLCSLLARRGGKTVVFTFFRETLHALETALTKAGIRHASFSGEQTAAEKTRALAEFAGACPVLLSTDVGSEGQNLQFCHAIVNFDLPWNPMRIEQRVGRVHRIGQRQEVLIDNFCARHTIEDHLLRILDAKLNMFELVIGEIGAILGNMEGDQDVEEHALEIWTRAGDDAEAERGFDDLADRLIEARARQRAAQELDEALFGDELAVAVAVEANGG